MLVEKGSIGKSMSSRGRKVELTRKRDSASERWKERERVREGERWKER